MLDAPLPITDTELPAPALCSVDDVMTRAVVSVHPDTSLETLAELMLARNISGVPVVNARGRLIGMVTKTDLVRVQSDPELAAAAAVTLPDGQHEVSGLTVGEIMSPRVLALRTGSPLSEAAELMVQAGIHRVPVVTAEGQLLGLVSTSDIVRWVAGLP